MRKSDFTLPTLDAGGTGRRQAGEGAEYSTGRAAPVQGSPLQGAEQRGDAADDREYPQGGGHHPGTGKAAA